MAEVVVEEALRAGDIVGGGRDGFGAYEAESARGRNDAPRVNPCSIGSTEITQPHAVLAVFQSRLTRVPVCERAVLFH